MKGMTEQEFAVLDFLDDLRDRKIGGEAIAYARDSLSAPYCGCWAGEVTEAAFATALLIHTCAVEFGIAESRVLTLITEELGAQKEITDRDSGLREFVKAARSLRRN